jgi:DNA-binding MarR family transcriptional regulator
MDAYETQLHEKLRRLMWLATHTMQRAHRGRGPWADASRGQGRVLAALKMQSEISTKDLAYLLGIRPQSLNELLSKLERQGFITREASAADKRVFVVKITDKGRNEEQETSGILDIFNVLNEDEKRTFGEYLDRVNDSLEAEFESAFPERRSGSGGDPRGGFGPPGRGGFGHRGRGGFGHRGGFWERDIPRDDVPTGDPGAQA